MTAEVEWVLQRIDDYFSYGGGGYGETAFGGEPTLKRVNRDRSEVLEGSIRTREADLQDANYVGAALADRSSEALGTEFNLRVETIVGIRVEGLHHTEYGFIDEDDEEGVPFDELVDDIKQAIWSERSFPDVGREDTQYHTLYIENEAPRSAEYSDYYRYDADVRLVGYRTLPEA